MVTSGQPERRLLWHPRRENKFVLGGGSQITLYEYTPGAFRLLTAQHDLQFMKCFAWSPDPAFDDLIAVGSSTGKVDLLRLEATKASGRNNVLSSGPIVPLTVRNSRSCNALAFCTADPNYLAVGLDKVRGDCSLMIWDIQSSLPTLSVDAGGTSVLRPEPQIPRVDAGHRADQRVLQQRASTDIVSSLSFVPQSIFLLLAGISYRWLRLFDLRSQAPFAVNVALKVQGIVTDPFDAHRIACFGDGIVTVWDTRKLTTAILTFTEKDASADGAAVRPGSNPAYTTIEFSSIRRGMLAALEKDASYVRFWDILSTQGSSDPEHPKDPSRSSKVPRTSWTNLPWAAGSGGGLPPVSPKESDPQVSGYEVVISDTRKTKRFNRSIASFALVPSAQIHPSMSKVMVVNKDGDLELCALHDTPKQVVWSARGDLAFGAGQAVRILPGFHDAEPSAKPQDGMMGQGMEGSHSDRTREASSGRSRGRSNPRGDPASGMQLNSDADASRVNSESQKRRSRPTFHEKSDTRSRKITFRPIFHVVENDISMIMRRRAIRGYGVNKLQYGLATAQDDFELSSGTARALSELWEWITHSKEFVCTPTPRIHGYDFTDQGMISIWEGFQPSQIPDIETTPPVLQREFLPSDFSSSAHLDRHGTWPSTADGLQGNFQAALKELAVRKLGDNLDWKPVVSTSKTEARRVALLLCGWPLEDDEFTRTIKGWEKEGKQSRATCWLVFTKHYEKAVELLMRSQDESHNMMSGTLAALIPHAAGNLPPNTELRHQCERLIVRLQDPYFRAMLTYLIMGDWSEVLDEETLPLHERLAIAFQFLDDKAVSSYLHRMKDRCRAQGDIDGLILTGLTKSGMDILQSYVDCTGDIQTAAILSSHVNSSDPRVERWREAYRDLLDGFKLYHHRVNFDIERGLVLHKAYLLDDNQPPPPPVFPQILIRCNYCSKTINPRGPGMVSKGRPTGCPYCGRALPRCSICLMTLSIIPDDTREAELAHSPNKEIIDEAIVICQRCRHGGHASHVLEWFDMHAVCPVADCDCPCLDEE